MSTDLTRLLAKLSRADIENLLAAKDEVESLETRRAELEKELAKIDNRLAKLASAVIGGRRGAGKKTRKKAAKKTTKKAAKKAAKKTLRGAAKKGTKKTTRKVAAGRKVSKGKKPRPKLDDVVVALIKKNGGPMSFKDIYATIVKRKLVTTRSKQFDNVLRRTLSTSKNVKRVARGVYGI